MSRRRRSGRTRRHPASLRRLLLTGIPATGKTSAGEYLREHHGFRHLDFETADLHKLAPAGFNIDPDRVRLLNQLGRDVVISWGFVPDSQLNAVRTLRDLGFSWVWFDGDREVAHRAYTALHREEFFWDRQLAKIESSIDPIMDELAPIAIDTFDPSGHRRPLDEIVQQVLAETASPLAQAQ